MSHVRSSSRVKGVNDEKNDLAVVARQIKKFWVAAR